MTELVFGLLIVWQLSRLATMPRRARGFTMEPASPAMVMAATLGSLLFMAATTYLYMEAR